jgi:hypothetical protein
LPCSRAKAALPTAGSNSSAFVIVPRSSCFGPDEVSDDEARKVYEANPGRFGKAERRTIQQISFPDEATAAEARANRSTVPKRPFTGSLTLPCSRAKAALPTAGSNSSAFVIVPSKAERRTIQQISFPDEATAAEARAKIESGETPFETVAADRGLDPKQLDLGTMTKAELFDPAVGNAAPLRLAEPAGIGLVDLARLVVGHLVGLRQRGGVEHQQVEAAVFGGAERGLVVLVVGVERLVGRGGDLARGGGRQRQHGGVAALGRVAVFFQTLQRAGLNEAMFVREQRSVIARLQLADAIVAEMPVPQAIREAVHRYSTERRDAAVLTLAHEHRLVQARPLERLEEQRPVEAAIGVFEARLVLDRPQHRRVGDREAESPPSARRRSRPRKSAPPTRTSSSAIRRSSSGR